MIVTKAILVEIGLEIFRTNGMMNTANTAFYERPEALDRVNVGVPFDVFAFPVLDNAVRVSELLNEVVAGEFVRMDSVVNVSRNVIPDYRQDGFSLNVQDHLCRDLRFVPIDQADNGRFPLGSPASCAGVFPTDVSLVNLGMPVHRLGLFVHKCSDLGEHSPSGLIGDTQFPFQLLRRDTRSSRRHEEHSVEPRTKRRSRFMEDGSGCGEHVITAKLAGISLSTRPAIVFGYFMADEAIDAFWIACRENEVKTQIIIRELLVKLLESVSVSHFLLSFLRSRMRSPRFSFSLLMSVCRSMVFYLGDSMGLCLIQA